MPDHPAKFNSQILLSLQEIVDTIIHNGYATPPKILDAFAGTGRIHDLHNCETFGIEIEKPYADMHKRTRHGDATCLPYPDDTFQAWVTSIVYGNRMSDSHKAKEGSKRNTYTHTLRVSLDDPDYELHDNNAGKMFYWNPDWKALHAEAFAEALRVVEPGGFIVVNVKNFYRTTKGETKLCRPVEWCLSTLSSLGCSVVEVRKIECSGNGQGANGKVRVPYEHILVMQTPEHEVM